MEIQIIVTDIKEADVRVIKKGTPDYPARMRELPDMPDVLYCLGELPDEDAPTVGIVGARMCTPYGRRMAAEFSRALAAKGVQIISGMALGVDGWAHHGCLDAGGRTFAVLGGGVNVCYPAKNKDIYDAVRKRGGILSEQPAGVDPLPYHFPRRNRIISALSDIVLVVEARQKSGSLITAGFAAEQGKDVFAVPGRVGDALSDGCNALIADGAYIAVSPESVLARLETIKMTLSFAESRKKKARKHKEKDGSGIKKYIRNGEAPDAALSEENAAAAAEETQVPEKLPDRISPVACCIYHCLDSAEVMSAEMLAARTGLTAREISASAAELLLEGLINEVGRGFYVRKC